MGDSARNGLSVFFGWIPQLLGALAILVIGYFVGKVIQRVIRLALTKLGFDQMLHRGSIGQGIARVLPRPSRTAGKVGFWAVMLGAWSLALTALGIPALTAFVAAIYDYLPNVLAAILIFLAASGISAAVAAFVVRTLGDTPTGKIVGTVVPIITMSIAGFMILNQLGIAPAIVTITYAALMGSIALGAALAFGLGGRDVAARMLDSAYTRGQEMSGQARSDFQTGVRRSQRMMNDAKQQADRMREKREPVRPE